MSTPSAVSATTCCPLSGARDTRAFFHVAEMPAHVGIQWPDRNAALQCPKGEIALYFSAESGHIFNAAFDPALMEYSQAYDNSLHYSPRFDAYTREVVERLITRYDLRDKQIVEIGCGKGDFLMMLATAGNNRGIGFDPSYEEREIPPSIAERVTFVQDFYSEAYAHHAADLVCSRYVFEHIPTPIPFLQSVRRTIGDCKEIVVYFEVPNVAFILEDLSVWDIIYEHCAYFSAMSLAYAFARCDFRVCDVVAGYDGQFLGIEAVPVAPGSPVDVTRWENADVLREQVEAYEANFRQTISAWEDRLARMAARGQKGVLWGAGAKAVGFLNMLKIYDQIEYVVDINPNKQGKFMAGTGQQIVAPEFLTTLAPDVVVVMNPIYKDEIKHMLTELGVDDVEFLYAS